VVIVLNNSVMIVPLHYYCYCSMHGLACLFSEEFQFSFTFTLEIKSMHERKETGQRYHKAIPGTGNHLIHE
jgi:hypothetical protein